MTKQDFIDTVNKYGDAIITYRSTNSNKLKYNVCTLDFSPKYIHPVLPILIVFQSLTLMKIYQFFYNIFQKNIQQQKVP